MAWEKEKERKKLKDWRLQEIYIFVHSRGK